MTNKDVFTALLCSYGYDRNIEIKTFRGDDGDLGYEISAENKDGDIYSEADCEGFMYNIYEILSYMKDNNVNFKHDWWSCSMKYVSDDNLRNSTVAEWDKRDKELQESITKRKPLDDWRKANNPCHTCTINKHDHWDDIHYNCELCHTYMCSIMIDFEANYQKFMAEFMKEIKE